MQGIPTWMSGDAIVITRTFNGYAVVQSPADSASQSVSFETWGALAYYLEANFVPSA